MLSGLLSALLAGFSVAGIAASVGGSGDDNVSNPGRPNKSKDIVPDNENRDDDVVAAPVQEEPEAPAPEEPVAETPEEPRQEAPREPEAPAPEEPVAETPEEPRQEAPREPEAPAPEEPVAETPEEPRRPEEPVAETPQEPTPVVEPTPYTGPLSQVAGENVTVGRVTTLELNNPDDIASVRILSDPIDGNVTVNADNTLALVLTTSQTTGDISFDYEVTYKDGSVQGYQNQHTVLEGTQDAGWGQGNFYMLETDENDNIVVETGEEHRPVYVSGGDHALSRAEIAALEGLNVKSITDTWLVENPKYGGSADMALDTEAGLSVWDKITSTGDKETSNWLLFEKGYSYEVDRLVGRGVSGEDELHPLHITSYGQGDDAVIASRITIYQETTENVVFSDLRFGENILSLSGENMIFDGNAFDWKVSLQHGDGLTFRNSEQSNIAYDTPTNGGEFFEPHGDRLSGLYMANNNGVLIEGNLWNQIGWADGFTYDGDADYGQAPSKYSHNVYLQNNTLDVTYRDNISMQAASFGTVLRGGGFVEDNVMLENNGGLSVEGGDYLGAGTIGTYSFVTDNVTTSAAYKQAVQTGAKSWGMQILGNDATLSDNIVAHLADPNDPDDLEDKIYNDGAIRGTDDFFFNDTIVYNWTTTDPSTGAGAGDSNVDDLNKATLDQTTIQRFAAQLLGDENATISDLGDYLRDNTLSDVAGVSDADLIIAYFQDGFGLTPEGRVGSDTLRFTPNELADGIRWDNRANWDTDDLPGTFDGDSVDLAGNWVTYGGTTRIDDLDFGDGGKLSASHGKLTVEGDTTAGAEGAEVNTSNAGQIWMNGYEGDGTLTLNVDGGRFANTADVTGTTDTNVTDGQLLLATDDASFRLDGDSSLNVLGSYADVGFEGREDGTGVLLLEQGARINFVADEEGFSAIAEFRSGAFDQDEANIESGVNLGLSTLSIDVAALDPTASEYTLMDVDGLIGELAEVHMTGLSDTQDAELIIDYSADTVSLRLLAEGSGSGLLSLSTVGSADDAQSSAALWSALTEDQPLYEDDEDTDIFVDEIEIAA